MTYEITEAGYLNKDNVWVALPIANLQMSADDTFIQLPKDVVQSLNQNEK